VAYSISLPAVVNNAKIIARRLDGTVLKGHTRNFDPGRSAFTLMIADAPEGEREVTIRLDQLKAVFFVKDFEGNPEYNEKKEFFDPLVGRRLQVTFTDGETLFGTSLSYDAAREGFFLFPVDRFSNNDKVFVVAAAVAHIKTVPP
jgi:hypothetical protein